MNMQTAELAVKARAQESLPRLLGRVVRRALLGVM
ncbi:MAG: hypothetical protein JWP79_3230, partial [Polaromonas sp.]|nr:hypothetical protein [Polaromonas sp.]